MAVFLGRCSPTWTAFPVILTHPFSMVQLQTQLPDTLNQLLRSLRELLLFLYHSILLPTWHMLLEALAQIQEHCHEACR